ncbi:MAG: hypothetical protein APF78_05750 [Sphingomonadales bacterium BRH_c3]|nr:MAG: hypothetical protein APF78_05750 [Sphingomonadales bacterium BRH_c3]
MKQMIRTLSCIGTALALGGCQSFIGALGFGPNQSAQVDQRAEAFGSQELERGRLAMKQGHVAFAIQQFRMAALNERTAPDAFNGLGVAYAKLGRADLAERYFKTALELDSSNPKYAGNLAYFYNSPLGTSARALAMREREAADALAEAQKAAEADGLLASSGEIEHRGAVSLPKSGSVRTRVVGNEVRITSSPQNVAELALRTPEIIVRASRMDSADSAAQATGTTPVVGSRSDPSPQAARISLVGRAPAGANAAPVRITVTRGGTAQSSTLREASYPIRVALKRGD